METIKASLIAAAMQGGGGGNLGSLSVTENGTYTPQSTGQSVDGWNSVAVSVPISPLTVNANGTYTAQSGGYTPVTVNVPTYESEYQQALQDLAEAQEALEEMEDCCNDVADMLGVDAGCENIKEAVAELIIGSYPSTDDIPTDPEQEVGRYVSISSNGYAIIDTSWDGWYFVRGGWHRGGAYYNTKTVVMKKYNMSGELLSTTTCTLPVWVGTDNGGYDPPPDPGWSDSYKFEQLQNTSYRHYSAAVNTLTWYWNNATPTGDPPTNTGFTLDTSIT